MIAQVYMTAATKAATNATSPKFTADACDASLLETYGCGDDLLPLPLPPPNARSLIIEHFATILQRVLNQYRVLSDGASIRENLCLLRRARLHDIPEIAGRSIGLEFDGRTDRNQGR